ncbi:hypothetical protein [Alteromonas sp. C1M14]|uniref:hypothetical protein n=1 Tax=Alteromonas sp. C1M14 TaxID=2841567 RepID=UPI001C0812CD|nr:hypothetical protein [Alteromonas sp. C1M14]MBU2979974.1 hypothetical protein [Alteromonas sp. C1M14]
MKPTLLFPLIAALAGCSTLDLAEQKTLSIDDTTTEETAFDVLEIASAPGQLRNVYIWTKDKQKIVCPEPFPDIGMSTSFETAITTSNDATQALTSALDTANDSETVELAQALEASLKATSTVVALSGRSELTVLNANFASMVCILAANGYLEPDGSGNESPVQANVSIIIDTMFKMVEADRLKAATAEAKAKTEQTKAETAKTEAEAAAAKTLSTVKSEHNAVLLKIYKPQFDKTLEKCRSEANGDIDIEKVCQENYDKSISTLQ